jgi:hypothetical protein
MSGPLAAAGDVERMWQLISTASIRLLYQGVLKAGRLSIGDIARTRVMSANRIHLQTDVVFMIVGHHVSSTLAIKVLFSLP